MTLRRRPQQRARKGCPPPALNRALQQWQKLCAAHLPLCLKTYAPDGTLTSISPGLTSGFGYAPQEMIGRKLSELTVDFTPESWRQYLTTIAGVERAAALSLDPSQPPRSGSPHTVRDRRRHQRRNPQLPRKRWQPLPHQAVRSGSVPARVPGIAQSGELGGQATPGTHFVDFRVWSWVLWLWYNGLLFAPRVPVDEVPR